MIEKNTFIYNILLRIYDGSYNLIRITYIMHIYTLYQNRSISDHMKLVFIMKSLLSLIQTSYEYLGVYTSLP